MGKVYKITESQAKMLINRKKLMESDNEAIDIKEGDYCETGEDPKEIGNKTMNEGWKANITKALASVGLAATLLTGCNTEKAFQEKLMKDNPAKFKSIYKKNADGTYEMRPTYKHLDDKSEKKRTSCDSDEADKKRAKFVTGGK